MNPKMNSPITLVLLDRLNRKVFEFLKPYNECAELTVIHREAKTYVYQHQTEFSSDKIFFKEAKQLLDLDEVKGTVELKADFVRDPRTLDYALFLLQHNEISLAKAKEIVDYWSVGIDPLSSDLPVVSQDNPLLSENDAPMDILRQVREDIIVAREQGLKDAALISALLVVAGPRMDSKWKKDLEEMVERLTLDSHGKPVPQDLKAKYTIKVDGKQIKGLALAEGQPVEEFIFRADSDGNLRPEQLSEGMKKFFMPGVGEVVSMPIKGMFDGPVVGKLMVSIPQEAIVELQASMELAMRQFSDNVRAAVEKFHKTQ